MSQSNGVDLTAYWNRIQDQGSLPTPELARKWSDGVLRTLALNLGRGPRKELARALPEELARSLTRPFWLLQFRNKQKPARQFHREVALRSGHTDTDFARIPTRAVFHGVKSLAGKDVIDKVAESLAPEVRQIWESA
jgi:uncharacterized protein (DUF2267 family)